jgi:hypothetical protein
MEKKSKFSIAAVEQAIAKKYGSETIQNPKSNWTPEKEKDYLKQQEAAKEAKQELDTKTEKVEVDGVLVAKKLLNKDSRRSCPVCKQYSFKSQDDVYMTKFDCCFDCYIQWVEGREERWKKGWRPDNK